VSLTWKTAESWDARLVCNFVKTKLSNLSVKMVLIAHINMCTAEFV